MGTSVLLLCGGGEGNGILRCPWPLSNLALFLALLSVMKVQTGNEWLNPGMGEGEAALPSFSFFPDPKSRGPVATSLRVPGTHSLCWQQEVVEELLACGARHPAHLSHTGGISLYSGPDSIWVHRENPRHPSKSQGHRKKAEIQKFTLGMEDCDSGT